MLATITKWLILGALAVLIVWEFIALHYDRRALISYYVKGIRNYPMLMVVFGVLVGHFALDANAYSRWAYDFAYRHPWVPMCVGIALALSGWAMKR